MSSGRKSDGSGRKEGPFSVRKERAVIDVGGAPEGETAAKVKKGKTASTISAKKEKP